MAGTSVTTRDFFISRAGENAKTAVEIDAILRRAAYTTFIQDKDFGSADFMTMMADGFAMVGRGARLIALLSPHYMRKPHCMAEAQHPLIDDPANRLERLIVLRIADCKPEGHLKGIPYVDLVPLLLDAEGFERAVLSAVKPRGQREPEIDQPGRQILHPEVRAVPGFTGRQSELDAVDAALWKSGKAALTDIGAKAAAVKGLGGVGKSVLAQEYAWRNRQRYQGVWWVRAEKSETLLDDLIELGSRFIPGIREVPDRTKAAQAALDHIAQTPAKKPWLIVYDNVEQPGDLDNLTPASRAHVLITTRWTDWGKAAEPVKVGVFAPGVAAQFLLDATGRTDRAGADTLAAALGHLPLALDHAAAYCRRTGIDFAAYEKLAADLLRKAPKGVDYDTPVFATFELAIDKAVEACPAAEKLMGVCAFLAPDRIPLDLFTKDVLSEIERGEAVAALAEVSLVTLETLDDGSAGISVHRLVQQVVRQRLGAGATEMVALATRVVADAYPSPSSDVRSWPACRRLESHAAAVLLTAPEEGDPARKTARLLNQYAVHLNARAEFAAAEPLMRRALAIDEASFGPDHPKVATDLNNLAQLLHATNRLADAEPLMRRALVSDEASFGPDHPKVGIRLGNLAGLLSDLGRFDEVEPLRRRELQIMEGALSDGHPHIATALNNLAQLLQDTNRLAEAEPLMRRALAIDEASFGPDHPDVAIDLSNLAGLLRNTNHLGEAEPLTRRALAIFEKSLGADHPSSRTARTNLEALLAELASAAKGSAET